MPALRNPRHEKFAQLFADGVPMVKAYIQSGFSEKGASGGASVLSKRSDILKRVSELHAEKEGVFNKAQEAIEEDTPPDNRQYVTTTLTVFWVINHMKKIAEEALKAGDYSAAMEATKLLGKELHIFSEHENPKSGGPTKDRAPVQIGQVNIGALDQAMSDVGNVIEGGIYEERTEEPQELVVKDSHHRSRVVEGPEELEKGGHRFFDGTEAAQQNADIKGQRSRGEPLRVSLAPDEDE